MSEEFDESDIIFSDSFFRTRGRDDMNEKENRPVGFEKTPKTNRDGAKRRRYLHQRHSRLRYR
ncbi:unnamed protein product [Brassica napus]|uniref:(rape) hypothetical protein n=1 Tax=Brassica napus TaxID=3708 RepID=A0A816M231_BRANA|nr:unnamed protein product [Brassica napus]